jgi:hypothetical protein
VVPLGGAEESQHFRIAQSLPLMITFAGIGSYQNRDQISCLVSRMPFGPSEQGRKVLPS